MTSGQWIRIEQKLYHLRRAEYMSDHKPAAENSATYEKYELPFTVIYSSNISDKVSGLGSKCALSFCNHSNF